MDCKEKLLEIWSHPLVDLIKNHWFLSILESFRMKQNLVSSRESSEDASCEDVPCYNILFQICQFMEWKCYVQYSCGKTFHYCRRQKYKISSFLHNVQIKIWVFRHKNHHWKAINITAVKSNNTQTTSCSHNV